MTYISVDAELEGIDHYPAYELGEYIDDSPDCRVVSIGDYDNGTHHLAAAVEEEHADYVYLVVINVEVDAIIENLLEVVEDTDLEVIWDYYEDDFIIAREV